MDGLETIIGRKSEIAFLESFYNTSKFEMLVMHGRRRIGKTFLLTHFAESHQNNAIYFTADKSSEKTNVQNFCKELKKCLNVGKFMDSFETWNDVYSFLETYEIKERLLIIIDEFTYLQYSNPAYDSCLQNAIDKILRKKNIFLILCGSEISVIEDLFNNSTKPLYGRKTAELKLYPFTYKEAREFFPNYNEQEALIAYSIIGGIPLYLSLFDDSLSIRENIVKHCLSTTGFLFNEADNLLRMELKEPYYYKNIMLAINSGASKFNEIKEKLGDESGKISKYLYVLNNLGFIKKETPCGEKEKSRNTLYSISDNYFAFYFAFIYKHQNMLNGLINPNIFYEKEITPEKLNAFIGFRFENICKTYLREQFYNGKMPFFAEELGRWWGNNPFLKKQEEIDLLALNDENALICECKYTNEKFDKAELEDLQKGGQCINRNNKYYAIFTKSGVSEYVKNQIENNPNFFVFTTDDLYK